MKLRTVCKAQAEKCTNFDCFTSPNRKREFSTGKGKVTDGFSLVTFKGTNVTATLGFIIKFQFEAGEGREGRKGEGDP